MEADQELLRETTEHFIQSACPLTRVRSLSESESGVDADYLLKGAELGWFSLLVPEEHGGGSVSGNGVLDAAILAEERGRFLQPGPFVSGNVVAATIAANGSDRQRADILPKLLAGSHLAAWALADPSGDWSGQSGVDAEAAAGGWKLTGTKGFVQDASVASWLLVTAASGGQLQQFFVEVGAPGVRVRPLSGLDLSRRLFEVEFEDVAVSADQVVGGDATQGVEWGLQLALVLTVAESVGAMHELFRVTLDYAKARTAFGRPIGSFQAIKHLLADTSLLLEQSKAIAAEAAAAVQDGRSEASEVASMAKSFIGDAGVELSQNCWQVFGGIGCTWEHDNHLYLRRLALDAVLYGQPSWHRERICRIHGL